MIRILEEAIAKVASLPEAAQEEAAQILVWTLEKHGPPAALDDETSAAIDEGVAQAERGDFACEAEIARLSKRHGL